MSDIHTLSGAYALDAVDDIERASFTRHLAECPACVQEVAELIETAARLADAATITPPARLRARVLDAIGRTRQLGPQLPPLTARPGRVARATRRWRRWGIAVAAAVVLFAAGGGTLAEEQRVRDAQHQATQAAEIQAVLTSPDAVTHTTPGPDGQGRVTLVMSLSRDEAVAMFGGLESPGVDRTYQLWTLRDEQPTDKGKLGTGVANGSVLVEGVRDAQTFAVSNEPAGGSRTPSTMPVTIPLT